ncbi:hypothetical protein J8L88_05925 [Aquimarina sp. MMG015]|uniref:BF3164 family lipoprotein n=1 Tax=Aquimarina sp. MMG015 TaxID=2822689 RepID=UPI001B3A2648|nr:BF3164 family lipoprotein [Aquimarina sp. MMG015]MBQ4802389.1 hypothetical protein [Aquimarina sp. MMG015]
MLSNPSKRVYLLLVLCCYGGIVYSQYLGKEYKKITNESFVDKVDLVSEKLDIGSDKLVAPLRLTLLDNHLVIHDTETQKHLHLIDIENNKYVDQYIGIGNGPNELSDVGTFEKNGNTAFIVWDQNDKKYLYYELQDLINLSNDTISKKLDEDEYIYFLNYDKNNQKLWYAGQFSKKDHRIYEKDMVSGTVKGYGTLLNPPKGKLNSIAIRNFISTAKMEKNDRHIVIAYETVPLLEVFNTETKEFASVLVPHSKLPIYYADKEEDNKMLIGYTNRSLYEFLDIKLTDTYIYAVYRGKEFGNTDPKKSVIYVFDYQLNPIRSYRLDQEVTSIAVYDDKIIYGLHLSPFIPWQKGKLIKYDIKK